MEPEHRPLESSASREVDAGWRRPLPAHGPGGPEPRGPHHRRELDRRRVPHRRRRRKLEGPQPGRPRGVFPGQVSRVRAVRPQGRPARRPARAPVPPESLGPVSERRRRRFVDGHRPRRAFRFRFLHGHPSRRPRHRLHRSDSLGRVPLHAGRQAPRLPDEKRRRVMGGDDPGTAAEGRLRDDRPRRDGRRRPQPGRRLLRDAERKALRVEGRGGLLGAGAGRASSRGLREDGRRRERSERLRAARSRRAPRSRRPPAARRLRAGRRRASRRRAA